jgi:hypothetical protein
VLWRRMKSGWQRNLTKNLEISDPFWRNEQSGDSFVCPEGSQEGSREGERRLMKEKID